jgi:hypothetical protein
MIHKESSQRTHHHTKQFGMVEHQKAHIGMWLAPEGWRCSSRSEGSNRWDEDSCRNLLMEITASAVDDMEPFMAVAGCCTKKQKASQLE